MRGLAHARRNGSGAEHLRSNFRDILARRSIVLCVGSGGVGKTTTSTAIALEGARRGLRTLVLTIDPAKRLADSLGLASLGHSVQQVPSEMIDAAGRRRPGGELWAMMLDQKTAFDEVVARHGSDPAAVQRILDNPVYGEISGSLAGSQEYAALAKLYEFDAEGTWNLIVVDTPPTEHALDFLDAPEKLTLAIDSPAVEWFRKLRARGSGAGWSMAGKTGAYVLKRLAKFVGSRFLDDLAVFFTEFNDILGGFRQSAEAVFELLRQPRVGFVLVSSPESMSVDEALYFHERLVSSSMPFAGFVVNKVHDDLPIISPTDKLVERAETLPPIRSLGLDRATMVEVLGALLENHAALQELAAADAQSIERLRAAGGPGAILLTVPFFQQDVRDIAGLAMLGNYLFSEPADAGAAREPSVA
jgi:anion-transporting  ArsA/GET3 family ATPase